MQDKKYHRVSRKSILDIIKKTSKKIFCSFKNDLSVVSNMASIDMFQNSHSRTVNKYLYEI